MQKITTFLTFKDQAEAAVNLYTSLFKNSKVIHVVRNGKSGPGPEGTVMSITFEIEGQQYIALNAGQSFPFGEGVSLFVMAENQEEIDKLYDTLSDGGVKQPCGWLKDKFGVSWQIIPPALGKLLNDPDQEKAGRVMQAMLNMKKIDIKALENAYSGK